MSQQHVEFEVALDLNETQTWDGDRAPLVPVGDYPVRIVEFGQQSFNGKPAIAVKFEITEGEQAGNRLQSNYFYATDAGAKRLKCLAIAVGAALEAIRSSDYMGQELMVTVVHNDAEPKVQADGSLKAGGTFANIMRERAISSADAEPAPVVEQPPVTRAKARRA